MEMASGSFRYCFKCLKVSVLDMCTTVNQCALVHGQGVLARKSRDGHVRIQSQGLLEPSCWSKDDTFLGTDI